MIASATNCQTEFAVAKRFFSRSIRFFLWLVWFCFPGVIMAAEQDVSQTGYIWDLPSGFPVPIVPASNPMSESKVVLGRLLLYE
ncbi:MAG: hypothetical protein ACI9SC_001245 [Gammaproteobacteria bacterium]|jgi:hypothetical protein